MKLNKIILLLVVSCFVAGCFIQPAYTFFGKKEPVKTIIEKSEAQNDTWCITFQLVWNEFMDKITNGKPVYLEGGNPPLADELNKRLYTKSDISENSYYIKNGKISKKLKKQIEKDIKKKFNEKSDILIQINWNAKNSYLFYAILKKEFTFLTALDKLEANTFNNSEEKVKYFGINNKSKKSLYDSVDALFYNNADDFAVKLVTKEKEDVILLRTDSNKSFEDLFAYINENTGFVNFNKNDLLLIPEIDVNKTISYDVLCNKKIEDTNYVISQALQTIKFKMDNKGGSLKSEAALGIMKMSLLPIEESPKLFLFNKPFVLFLVESGKDKPYYAMKIENTNYLVKEISK